MTKNRQKNTSKTSINSFRNVLASGLSLALLFSSYAPFVPTANAQTNQPSVSINEIAWMGTTSTYNGEWMELYNNTNEDISLEGWQLKAKDGTPSVQLKGVIKANGYFLLERTSDATVGGVPANQIYTGALGNSSESLELYDPNGNLVDTVSAWYAGNNTTKATMERVSSTGLGDDKSNWVDSETVYNGGFGTPGSLNSKSVSVGSEDSEQSYDDIVDESDDSTKDEEPYVYQEPTQQHINQVSEEDGAINVYFNKSALTEYAYEGNEANYQVNLEDRLLKRINDAKTSIDIATYEINLPRLVEALQEKASEGVEVRMIADAKGASDSEHDARYEEMRLSLEKLSRGKDNVLGTMDDVHIISDSVIFAVENSEQRTEMDLPVNANDIPTQTVKVGSKYQTGRVIVDGERKADGGYYSPDNQMHNKFVNVDNTWVWTGSWNFTVTGLYGSENNMKNNVYGGNQQHSVEMKSSELADIYKNEFEEMYGSSNEQPNPTTAKFHGRKTDNTAHQVYVGDRLVEVYFSPGDGALEKMTNLVKEEANQQAFFTIFSWSDQKLVDELKYKWEGSYEDMVGTRTGFEVKGLFDKGFTNQYWSANIDMQGRTVTGSKNNPNTRWANPAPVFQDREARKLHAKTMVIDADTNSDPTVVMGSTNWSTNGDSINDENMLFIHDKKISNQFVQEFYARYKQAGVSSELMHSELNLLERSKQAVEKAETTKDSADIGKAKSLVSGLQNEENQSSLSTKIVELEKEIAYNQLLVQVEKAVANAELAVTQESVDYATSLLVQVKDMDKEEFATRLDVVQEAINYAIVLNQAVVAVEKAELTQSQEDVYQATLLFTDLKESDVNQLTDRLNKIVITSGVNNPIKVKQALKEVYLAEKVGNATHIRKANELVSELFKSPEKTEMQLRLNSLK